MLNVTGIENGEYLEYKSRPLVRKDDEIFYGDLSVYYVKMMIAWYFATALSKDFKRAVSYLEDSRLDKWVHNKTIQKGIESYRLTEQEKSYLRNLRK